MALPASVLPLTRLSLSVVWVGNEAVAILRDLSCFECIHQLAALCRWPSWERRILKEFKTLWKIRNSLINSITMQETNAEKILVCPLIFPLVRLYLFIYIYFFLQRAVFRRKVFP